MKLSVSENVHIVEPLDFEASEHWYPRALNSSIHPLVSYFMSLSSRQYAERYCRLNPNADPDIIREVLAYQPVYFRWSGTDLMHVTNQKGQRKLTVIETNSCPSGQKSMPLLDWSKEKGGYKRLLEDTFLPMVKNHDEEGALAVVYDKNPMENVGYAATISDLFKEEVYLLQIKPGRKVEELPLRFIDKKMYVRGEGDKWIPVRAAFRYITQNPWDILPLKSRTLLLNPIEACLAGGRNKQQASIAYDHFNHANKDKGVSIFTPKTFREVSFDQLEGYFEKLSGSMVVKVPDSNAGQGVRTITSPKELAHALKQFKEEKHERFIVQQLISSNAVKSVKDAEFDNWYHVGTIPDYKGRSYAFDIRMMMQSTAEGMRPVGAYSRRARFPLNEELPEGVDSWEVYGTNLSVKSEDGWSYDDNRLMLFDVRNFGGLGLGIDELIQGFIQSCMAVFAIDQQAINMFSSKK